MALYHLTVSQIRRSAGQSAIAAAAYRAGECLYSDYYGEYSDYTRKGGVICSEILLPPHAPLEYQDRATLWNTVEQVEKHKKAQLAYSFDKAEVDGLFAKMYEDWAAGRITEYNFNMLSEKYQGEQKELDEKIQQLHEAMEAVAQTAVDAEKWVGLMRQYVNPTELTAELLNTLIEKIFVHEAVKGEDGSREQEVEIFYRFIGKID